MQSRNRWATAVKPDEEICGEYLHRYHLIPKNRLLNIYLHRFQEPDPGRDLHDHPWWSVSIVLKGRYVERYSEGGEVRTRTTGGLRRCIRWRRPTVRHTITWVSPEGCWTVFITGPKVREWGFHTGRGWIHNQAYDESMRVAPLDAIAENRQPAARR